MAKPSGSGLEEFAGVHAEAMLILNSVAAAHGATVGAPVQVDVDTTRGALLLAYAWLLDIDPEMQTTRDIRLAAEHARDVVKVTLMSLKEFKARQGKSYLETIGLGRDPVMRPPDRPSKQ